MAFSSRIVLSTVLVLCAACDRRLPAPAADGVLRVDGRSAASFATSVRAMKYAMTSDEQSAVADAALWLASQASRGQVRSGVVDPTDPSRAMRECLHGMSLAEILTAAQRMSSTSR